MSWTDLSDVTQALITLLTQNIAIALGQPVNVVATPPDRVDDGAANTLSLYMYHLRETAATQNLPGPGSDRPDIATTSLGMDLFYVITAHQKRDVIFDALMEQRLLGFALKTLHDYPVVTDATVIAGMQIMPLRQRGRANRLNVEFRKLDSEQAFSIWTTGERQFTRLAAYFQVGLVMLFPQAVQQMPGIVLSVGTVVTPIGAPTLTSSSSLLPFTLPPSLGGSPNTITAQPARPFLTAAPGPLASCTLQGQDLTLGVSRRLLLRTPRWQRLAPPVDRVPLDLALNAANGWVANFATDHIDLQVGPQLSFTPGGGPVRTIPLFPGSYGVALEVTVANQVVAGQLRARTRSTNEVTFGLSPRVTGHVVNAGPQTITINLDPAFPANVAAPDPLEIELAIDGEVYERNDPGPLLAGQFQVLANSIVVAATFNVAVAGEHPLRLLIEGVDAQPYWITTP
jgi:hypothetical protein